MSLYRLPHRLIKKYETRNPFALAWYLEIPAHKVYHPESNLPGLTSFVASRASIFINEAYFEIAQRMDPLYTDEMAEDDMMQVCAHELGHAILHKKETGTGMIKEYEIFNVRTRLESEANQFAAGIRIDQERMIELFNSGLDLLQVASSLHVNINLLIYALGDLRKSGFQLPFIPKNNFMGHIHGIGSSEWS